MRLTQLFKAASIAAALTIAGAAQAGTVDTIKTVSYTHLRAHET